MINVTLLDSRSCTLGEGPLWHPQLDQLFWFDIVGQRLRTRTADGPRDWSFNECVSAAGWTGAKTLLIASETALLQIDLISGAREVVLPLEADTPETRSNDGRADPWGGFWIGTMGKGLEPGAGAIYRYFRGELRRLFSQITIPNAISFSPDGHWLYFTDTPTRQIWRQALREDSGWPADREPELFVDLGPAGLNPDGAVVDRDGYLWNAQWGASRVARYSPEGRLDRTITFPARQTSCPAFGGDGLATLFVTSAREGLNPASETDGQTFAADLGATGVAGQAEHRVLL